MRSSLRRCALASSMRRVALPLLSTRHVAPVAVVASGSAPSVSRSDTIACVDVLKVSTAAAMAMCSGVSPWRQRLSGAAFASSSSFATSASR
eukprot:scaffold28807_cov67-Phaeocystis_antarctica.AAC.5